MKQVSCPGEQGIGCGGCAKSGIQLRTKGFVISDFFYTAEPSIRVGCIGAISREDVGRAADAMGEVLEEMKIRN